MPPGIPSPPPFLLSLHKFKSHGQVRPAIRFHPGLNTVLGDREGTNSIGKSTFLLIIDYAFGGDDYLKSNALSYVGDHTIHFKFSDASGEYFFCRKTNEPTKAFICNAARSITEEITLDDYKKKLAKMYDVDISFRSAVGLYFRIYGKDNHNERKPLNLYGAQSDSEAITDLQQLFGESALVKDRKAEEKKRKTTRDTYKAANKEKFITVITSVKAKKQAEAQLSKLREELQTLIADYDKKTNEADLAKSDEAAAIKKKLRSLRRNRSALRSQLENIDFNIQGITSVTQADIDDLAYFFPQTNIKELYDIEHFHKKIQTVLNAECKEEQSRIYSLLSSVNSEIEILEAQYHQTGLPATLSGAFLNKHAELSICIRDLETQIQSYDNQKQYDADWKAARLLLEEAQANELPTISQSLNAQMIRYNDLVMGEDREAPHIDLKNGKSYNFGTASDDGTGNNYKNLIIFDMSVLALTQLPAVIHDSFILKDIGDAPIENIIKLYQQSKKQVFISLDKSTSYRPTTASALDATQVLYLSEDDNQLFGWAWNKKTT